MKQINEHISLVSSFYEGVDMQTITECDTCIVGVEDFASYCVEAIHVIDFKKRNFVFVADHDLFLCGHSSEDVLKMGYDFYPKIIPEKDLKMLIEIHREILKIIPEKQNEIDYFSFNIKMKSNYKQANRYEYLMVYHKLIPKFNNGKIQGGICLLTCSVISESGNLRLHYKNSQYYEEYSFDDKQWYQSPIEHLTKRETEILTLAKHGKRNQDMSDKLCISDNTLKNEISRMLKKFNLKNIPQLIIHATNNLLIFHHSKGNRKRNP